MSYTDKGAVKLKPKAVGDQWSDPTLYAVPGDYTVTLSKRVDGKITQMAPPQDFKVLRLRKGALEGASYDEITNFIEGYQDFKKDLTATTSVLANSLLVVDAMKRAADKSTNPTDGLFDKIHNTRVQLLALDKELSGDKTKGEIGEKSDPNPGNADYIGLVAAKSSTYGPTPTHKAVMNKAILQLDGIRSRLSAIVKNVLPGIERDLKDAGAPWIEGQELDDN